MTDWTGKAFDEAKSLGHGWVGTEHFLLALLGEPSVANEVLSDLGVTYDGCRREQQEPDDVSRTYDPEKGLQGPNPAGCYLIGRAQGMALARSSMNPLPEHLLIAMVFDVHSAAQTLYHLGAPQEAILEGLKARGVDVPAVDPPLYRPWRGHRQIEVPLKLLDPIIAILIERHPPGSDWRWSVNTSSEKPEMGYVGIEPGIDIEGIIREAQEKQGLNRP